MPPPVCPGVGGIYERESVAGGKPCTMYGLPCAQHAIDGMLATRGALMALVAAHEARRGVAFDSVLFVRPDLAELLPTEEGAPVVIELSAANASRLLDDEDAEVIAEGSKEAGLWVEKVALPHHSVGDAGAGNNFCPTLTDSRFTVI